MTLKKLGIAVKFWTRASRAGGVGFELIVRFVKTLLLDKKWLQQELVLQSVQNLVT